MTQKSHLPAWNLIKCGENVVGKLYLGDRPMSGNRVANAKTDNALLAERRVEHTFSACNI